MSMPGMSPAGRGRGLPWRVEAKVKQDLESLQLNTFSFPETERPAIISYLLEEMMLSLGVPQLFNVDKETMKKWIALTSRKYQHVPYHNYHHCFSVTHMAYLIIIKCKLLEKIGREMCVYLLVSAVCHDLDHPGLSNSYLEMTKDVLAKKYKVSYLEYHHYEVSMTLLKESGMISHLTPEKESAFKEILLDLILATDLLYHKDILHKFQKVSECFDFMNSEHVLLLLKVILKACDVSNEVRPSDVAREWLRCLCTEFFAEGDKRQARGFEVPDMFSRTNASFPCIQKNFLSYIVLPMFKSIAKVLPEMDVHFTSELQQALARYEAESKGEEQK